MSRDDFVRRRREMTNKPKGRTQVSQYSKVNERQLQAEKVMQDNPHQTAILSRILRKHKHLHQDKFDEIFNDTGTRVITDCPESEWNLPYGKKIVFRRKIRWPFKGFDGYMMGTLDGGEWSKWLDLLKVMMLGNVVKRQGTHPNLIYSLRGSN